MPGPGNNSIHMMKQKDRLESDLKRNMKEVYCSGSVEIKLRA
jgi:hypothetical protein